MTPDYKIIDASVINAKIEEYRDLITETKNGNYTETQKNLFCAIYKLIIAELEVVLSAINEKTISDILSDAWINGCDSGITYSFSDNQDIMKLCIKDDREEYLSEHPLLKK